ncbi:MAG TPA: cellulose-binding protein [Polyangia bacterium]|nr:cellulose-binding protein [Polyangia bacterium]
MTLRRISITWLVVPVSLSLLGVLTLDCGSGTSSGRPGTGGSATGGSTDAGGGAGGTTNSCADASAAGGAGGGFTSTSEDEGASCTVAALPSASGLPSIALLPDPFKKLDGTEMTTKAEWTCRREEIRKQAEQYALGPKPAPPTVTGTVTSTAITVNVTANGTTASFSATVALPSTGCPPYPAIIGYGSVAPLDTSVIDSEGVATINFNPTLVGAEGGGHGPTQTGAFYNLYPGGSQTGLLVAWAWGVSRIVDVIAQSDGTLLRADAIGVTGCSHYGKGAFIAGAFDQRIALTLPVESGTAGVPTWRGIAKAEVGANGNPSQTLSNAYSEQPWFADGFAPFLSDPTINPIDTHEIVAMVAPRGLFIMDNPYIGELSPQYSYLATVAGAEVYFALGAPYNISYNSAISNGAHCAMRPEWSAPLKDSIEKFLTRSGHAAGEINANSVQQAQLSDWRDWTTPSLN